MVRWSWIGIGLLAACDDGSSSGRGADLDASAIITCTSGPDAATALGVRGVELWDAFEGTYTVAANRVRGGGFEAATFTVTVARSLEPAPGLDDCSEVAVPVVLTLTSREPSLNAQVNGALRGSLLSADITFATPEYVLGVEPRVYGKLLFLGGQPLQMRLREDGNGTWYAPPLSEAP